MNAYQLSRRYVLSLPLIAVIAACALWIVYIAGRDESALKAGLPLVDHELALEEIRLAPDYPPPGYAPEFSETTVRPLFNASRRPAPGAMQLGSANSGALLRGRYTLTGVSISPVKRVVLLRDAATGKTVRVEQGSEVSGMLVESVSPGKVVLKQGAEREEIVLTVAPAPHLVALSPPKSDPSAKPFRIPGEGAPPAIYPPPAAAPPVAASAPGAPRAAADIANADPITEADVAEREARVRARRNRQMAPGERVPR